MPDHATGVDAVETIRQWYTSPLDSKHPPMPARMIGVLLEEIDRRDARIDVLEDQLVLFRDAWLKG